MRAGFHVSMYSGYDSCHSSYYKLNIQTHSQRDNVLPGTFLICIIYFVYIFYVLRPPQELV